MIHQLADIITTEDELRELMGYPGERAVQKQIAKLDQHCVRFIERSPFMLIGSSDAKGRCDASPKGDGPGFVKVLDDRTLTIPDRPGNNRADTLTNIISNPRVGLIFLIPTVEDTLRVNGNATITTDADLLDTLKARDKTPKLAIVVEVEEVFFHCAKAFKRSNLWNPEGWADQSDLPSLGQILLDQINMDGETLESVECQLDEAYQTTLY